MSARLQEERVAMMPWLRLHLVIASLRHVHARLARMKFPLQRRFMAWARRCEPRPGQPDQAPRAGARSNYPWDLPWSDATDSSSALASLRRR